MDLQTLSGIVTEARTLASHIGTLSNTINLGKVPADHAYELENLLRRPEIGWHTRVDENNGEWTLTLTINVDRDKLQ